MWYASAPPEGAVHEKFTIVLCNYRESEELFRNRREIWIVEIPRWATFFNLTGWGRFEFFNSEKEELQPGHWS